MRESKAVNNEIPFPYVVDIEDNRRDQEPFTVWMTCATHADIMKMDEAQLSASMRAKGEAVVRASVAGISHRRGDLVGKYVTKVENYAVTDLKGIRHEPKTGAELVRALQFASPEEAETVLEDIKKAILDAGKAAAGVLGNSVASPPSS